DEGGAVVLRRPTRREGIIKLAVKLKSCVIAMEACCGAHHLGRVLRAQGHEVRLMSPEYVRRGLMARMHKNAAVVALANKLARMAWAVLRHNETFRINVSVVA